MSDKIHISRKALKEICDHLDRILKLLRGENDEH